jgi:hypothetical protein
LFVTKGKRSAARIIPLCLLQDEKKLSQKRHAIEFAARRFPCCTQAKEHDKAPVSTNGLTNPPRLDLAGGKRGVISGLDSDHVLLLLSGQDADPDLSITLDRIATHPLIGLGCVEVDHSGRLSGVKRPGMQHDRTYGMGHHRFGCACILAPCENKIVVHYNQTDVFDQLAQSTSIVRLAHYEECLWEKPTTSDLAIRSNFILLTILERYSSKNGTFHMHMSDCAQAKTRHVQ